MGQDKTFYELVNILHPPKVKFWIRADERKEAARALGESGKKEAVDPLVMALADKAVREAAAQALAMLPLPEESRGRVLSALVAYKNALVSDFLEEYFEGKHNAEVLTLSMREDDPRAKSEPEACLVQALDMIRQISPDKAQAIALCEQEGLEPGSRDKFVENVRLLDKHQVFALWPKLKKLDAVIQEAECIMALLGWNGPEKAPREKKPAPQVFNVVFSGRIKEGQDVETVKREVAALYKTDLSRVERLFSGQTAVLKKNTDLRTAQKLVDALEKAGALARMEPVE